MSELISFGTWALKLYVYAQIIGAAIIVTILVLMFICRMTD